MCVHGSSLYRLLVWKEAVVLEASLCVCMGPRCIGC